MKIDDIPILINQKKTNNTKAEVNVNLPINPALSNLKESINAIKTTYGSELNLIVNNKDEYLLKHLSESERENTDDENI